MVEHVRIQAMDILSVLVFPALPDWIAALHSVPRIVASMVVTVR